MHIVGQTSNLYDGPNLGLNPFDFDGEESLPRFFSAVMFLVCSGLLMTIAMATKANHPKNFLYWLGLAFTFLCLAIVKNNSLHISYATQIQTTLNLSKIQFYAWAYGILLVIFPIIYLKFFFSLPKRMMLLLAIGSSTFFIGAFGLDLIGAYLGNLFGNLTLLYLGIATLEEVLEMVSIIIFVYAFLSYIGSELKLICVRFIGE